MKPCSIDTIFLSLASKEEPKPLPNSSIVEEGCDNSNAAKSAALHKLQVVLFSSLFEKTSPPLSLIKKVALKKSTIS